MWADEHYENTDHLRLEFRKELERNQVLLDTEVVESMRKLDSVTSKFMDEVRSNPTNAPNLSDFKQNQLNPLLDEISDVVNESLGKTTQSISLRLEM